MNDHPTWEPDIENEEIDGVVLASLSFVTVCGMVKIDHFTPDALRVLADMLHTHAHTMDGREPNGVSDLKELLEEVHPHIGGYPYEVPDFLKDRVERAAGMNRYEVFSDVLDDFANPPTHPPAAQALSANDPGGDA